MIRAARPGDAAVVRAVVIEAFGRPDEADLVDRLRADGDTRVELVAERDGQVIGHVLYSALALIGPDDTLAAAALAPVSVTPEHQGVGTGGALIRTGNEACRDLGLAAVVVLGHPAYYPRFGFEASAARTLQAPFSGPSFMALALEPGAILTPRTTRYARAFGLR